MCGCIFARFAGEYMEELTAHLDALQVPQVLDCHLEDVRFLQLGVS